MASTARSILLTSCLERIVFNLPAPHAGLRKNQVEVGRAAKPAPCAASLCPAAPVGITAPPPALLFGRRGADLPRDAPLSAPRSHWPAGSRSQHPRLPTFGRRGADLPRDAPLSAPRPVGSRSQHPRLPHLWPAGSRPPRDAPLSASRPLGRQGADLSTRRTRPNGRILPQTSLAVLCRPITPLQLHAAGRL